MKANKTHRLNYLKALFNQLVQTPVTVIVSGGYSQETEFKSEGKTVAKLVYNSDSSDRQSLILSF